MKNLNFTLIGLITGLTVILANSAFYVPLRIDQIQLDMLIQTVSKGKKITTRGKLYYETANSKLVTRFTYPHEIISITNGLGEMKTYDAKQNSLFQKNGSQHSSKQSFLYHFTSGRYGDMGLQENGFAMIKSRIEDGMVISNWQAKKDADKQSKNLNIELVVENRLPIFMSYSNNGSIESKTYFTNYQNIGDNLVPFNITEIQYSNQGMDSVIIRKKYSNLLVNSQVDLKYLNFKIPSTAKLIEIDK